MKTRNGAIKTKQGILLLLICIAVNFGGKLIASNLNLPVWMDMTGTCIAIYYLGLPYGIIVAILNNILFCILDPASFIYVIVSIVCTVVFYICVKKGFLEKPASIFFSSFFVAFAASAASVPLNLIFYGGYSRNMWGDTLFDMLTWYGIHKIPAAIAGEVIVDVLDKQICLLICGLVIYGVKHIKKNKAAKEVTAIMIILLAGMLLHASNVNASEINSEKSYNSRIYDNQNGMMSSEANTIVETDDGYIWIGSYAGLTRYDGTKFEFIKENGIVSVTAMYCDSSGRLWVGTNDGGIARYEKGQFMFFKTENTRLPSNSIRSFCEDNNGDIYVGTTDRVCVIKKDDRIEILSDDVYYVNSMKFFDSNLICSGNDGQLYVFGKNSVLKYENKNELYFTCVSIAENNIMTATDSGDIYTVKPEADNVTAEKKMSVPLKNIHCINENSDGRIWLCADTGMGYIYNNKYYPMEIVDFNVSLENIHEDYQGNIWVASSRCGVLCLSPTPFENLFNQYKQTPAVCNAVAAYDNGYCIGTDSGLVMLNQTESGNAKKLVEMLNGARVRSVMNDSKGNLWICTYSEYGLVKMDKNGNISTYTTSQSPLVTSDRARCIIELTDGTIAVGTADGIYFIKDEKVTGNVTRDDGLLNSQILTLTEGDDGTLYAGSDGAGLFLIQNGIITKNYSVSDGLSSDVILRITRCDNGFLLVTSNSLNYLSEGKITQLKQFPYYNNYDILIKDNTAYVLSSAGIFVADVNDICSNNELAYSLYNVDYGFESAITANSWNYIGDDGALYICCNNGVVRFLPQQSENSTDDYKYGISRVVCDEKRVLPEDDRYILPENASNVTIYGVVGNFALQSLTVRFFDEKDEAQSEIVPFTEIEPIRLNHPSSGEHKIHFQIYDSSGKNMIGEKIYTVIKEKHIWENSWYRVYLIFMTTEIVIFIIWAFVLIIDDQRKKKALATFNTQLEIKVKEQTNVIRAQNEQKELLLSQTVFALANTVDAKDNYTSGHSRRVAEYAMLIAKRMGKGGEELEEIYRAGLLHDVGKIRVPEEIINKPGKLTEDEFAMIKLHPITGYHILKGVSSEKMFADGARFHHERFDGKGYPNGLVGEQIPEIARIIGVADAYDAMASRRSYRDIMPQEAVRNEILKGRGAQFDPEIADIMLELIDNDKEYKMKETLPACRKILAVDDEPMNIKLITFALKDIEYYKVYGFESGKEAIEALHNEQFDIALIDIKMPEMDGYETVSKIREFSNMPVVFMSVDKGSVEMEDLKKYSVTDFITKPFMPSALKEILHAVLSE